MASQPPPEKQLWILVGGNGAGKSTFHREALRSTGLPFVNADVIARQRFPQAPEAHSYQAAALARQLRDILIRQGQSFCYETVFSHPSKIDFIADAKAGDYQVILVFIHLGDPQLNQARVHQRTEEGGHQVPADKIRSRLPRTFRHVRLALPLCDQAHLIDNSSAEVPLLRVGHVEAGQYTPLTNVQPDWVDTLLFGQEKD
ncbi:zeta toxin family protein [Alcanivorax sp. 24]|uniref:zeta toxin family protein n=1 Tax=Alcanivorax sp. 24 TaxID=2545266 RepID=UPI00105E669A|nr:zeta toxin family protein [Alcanivorax sp. 24]